LYGFFEMVYRQPHFALGIEHTSQIRPGHGELRLGFDRF
jgi:hypothetical protein